jgi:hypothetical protein
VPNWQQEGEEQGGGMEEGGAADDGGQGAAEDWDENEPSPHQGEEGQEASS